MLVLVLTSALPVLALRAPSALSVLLQKLAAGGTSMPEPSEGVPPKATGGADEELAALRTVGEQQLRDGLFLDAVKTLTTALDLAKSTGATDKFTGLETLHEDAMQKAALVRVPRRAGQPASRHPFMSQQHA